jgi:hypothetical protein
MEFAHGNIAQPFNYGDFVVRMRQIVPGEFAYFVAAVAEDPTFNLV